MAKLGSSMAGGDPMSQIHEQLAQRTDVVSFAVGAPDSSVLPVELVGECAQSALRRWGGSALQYGSLRGFPPLLDVVGDMLAARGVPTGTERTHISTGGSGALYSIIAALIDPGDVVLVERPTYAPAVSVFRDHGAVIVDVDTDEQGAVPAALDLALEVCGGAVVYLLPTFQNPTGRTASAVRRCEIAEVVRRHGILAIEDDVYCDLRYRGQPVPALCSYAPEHVAYVTSLSKTLAPALRIGVTTMPPPLLDAVLRVKQGIDMQTSSFNQAVATELVGAPDFELHLARVVDEYGTRMDGLLDALARHMPSSFRWSKPTGGLFVWAEGPKRFDSREMLTRALSAGVAFMPGSAFHACGGGHSAMRLSIAGVTVADIDHGVEVLAGLCAGYSDV